MTIDLEAIEARARDCIELDSGLGNTWNRNDAMEMVCEDIPALVAEVRRLRETNRGLNRRLQEAESVLAKDESATRAALRDTRRRLEIWKDLATHRSRSEMPTMPEEP